MDKATAPQLILQSGVVAYRLDGADDLVICMITSKSRGRWIVPKGMLERDMTPAESAANEAFEEAGVLGQVHPEPLGEFQYQKGDGLACAVTLFPMLITDVLESWPEQDQRLRMFVSVDEAIKLIEEPELAEAVNALPEMLNLRSRAS